MYISKQYKMGNRGNANIQSRNEYSFFDNVFYLLLSILVNQLKPTHSLFGVTELVVGPAVMIFYIFTKFRPIFHI